MTDHILEAARTLVGASLDEMQTSIEGLPVEALNWRPAADANSIAAIATHSLLATRLWLRMAMGLPLPERDRDAEFHAAPSDAHEFLRFVANGSNECMEALHSADAVDWPVMRETQGRGGDAPAEVAAGYAVVHATEHLRGHVDQVSLMRQLWDALA
jgi:uncharacterized damage-inducible protein DinB